MTGTAADVLAIALAERGYREDAVNRTKFSVELDDVFGPVTLGSGAKVYRNTAIGPTQGMEWCAVFACWSYWKATGELPPLPSGGFYTPSDVNAWRTLGRLVTTPEPGDFVYYQRMVTRGGRTFPEAYHVGLVAEVRGARFSSIEGNTSPSSVVNPDGGGVFQFGPVATVLGDASDRVIATPLILFARPDYAPPPPPLTDGDDMHYVTNSEPRQEPAAGPTYPAGAIWYAIDPGGRLRNVKPAEARAAKAKGISPVPTPNNELDYQAAS